MLDQLLKLRRLEVGLVGQAVLIKGRFGGIQRLAVESQNVADEVGDDGAIDPYLSALSASKSSPPSATTIALARPTRRGGCARALRLGAAAFKPTTRASDARFH